MPQQIAHADEASMRVWLLGQMNAVPDNLEFFLSRPMTWTEENNLHLSEFSGVHVLSLSFSLDPLVSSSSSCFEESSLLSTTLYISQHIKTRINNMMWELSSHWCLSASFACKSVSHLSPLTQFACVHIFPFSHLQCNLNRTFVLLEGGHVGTQKKFLW